MATRSLIGIKSGDTFKVVYCHWDGYPANQEKLLANYKTMNDAVELIKGGDMSALGDSMQSTVYYHRDKGEDLNPPEDARSVVHLRKIAQNSDAEFVYIFGDNGWMTAKVGSGDLHFSPSHDEPQDSGEEVDGTLPAEEEVTETKKAKSLTQLRSVFESFYKK